MKTVEIAPATGKLGILLVGLGAVSTTVIAGVLAIRRGLSKPIGSLSQMGTLRLGKRTDNRSPRIADVLPLARLDDVVFGGWDLFDDNCYEAARTAGVLDAGPARADPARARGHQAVAGRLRPPVREAARRTQRQEGAAQAGPGQSGRRRHPEVQGGPPARSARDGVVRQHRDLHGRVACAPVAGGVRGGAAGQRRHDSVEHDLHLRRAQGGHPVCQRRAESVVRHPGDGGAGGPDQDPHRRQGPQDRDRR